MSLTCFIDDRDSFLGKLEEIRTFFAKNLLNESKNFANFCGMSDFLS